MFNVNTMLHSEKAKRAGGRPRKGEEVTPPFYGPHPSGGVRRGLRIQRKLRAYAKQFGRAYTRPRVQMLSIVTCRLEGGRYRFLEFVQLAAQDPEEHARTWLDAFEMLQPSEQERVSFDDVCAASAVRASALVAAMVSSSMRKGIDVARLVAAVLHPRIIG